MRAWLKAHDDDGFARCALFAFDVNDADDEHIPTTADHIRETKKEGLRILARAHSLPEAGDHAPWGGVGETALLHPTPELHGSASINVQVVYMHNCPMPSHQASHSDRRTSVEAVVPRADHWRPASSSASRWFSRSLRAANVCRRRGTTLRATHPSWPHRVRMRAL